MTPAARNPLYRRHRFPAEVIAHAVWLYFRFPLSLRMVEDLLAARGIIVSHQTVRLWRRNLVGSLQMKSAVGPQADLAINVFRRGILGLTHI
jgi:putative transposase